MLVVKTKARFPVVLDTPNIDSILGEESSSQGHGNVYVE